MPTETSAGKTEQFDITVEPSVFKHGLDHAYKTNKNKLNVPGFRKGKTPQKLAEKMF
ncbi:MAG: trigger factor family protein, partial [Clostridiales bacterium]|nr:trigger factor family protein [Clostridiales bacterium]